MSLCRFCRAPLNHSVVNLGATAIANDLLSSEQLTRMEPTYPLHAMVCEKCWLVQLDTDAAAGHIFGQDYVYFSSFSASWLRHAEEYAAQMRTRFHLGPQSLVMEIASNDGYLLQYFQHAGIPVLGIEPSGSVAAAAKEKNIPTQIEFFNRAFAEKYLASGGPQADLITANNVMAHVPDVNDFVAGFASVLKPTGVLTIEFPHLLNLIRECQFDTIYHEHYSYYALVSAQRLLAAHGLTIFDVEELPTHGGSLRIYAMHRDTSPHPIAPRVDAMLERERATGMETLEFYQGFAARVIEIKCALLEFLIDARRQDKKVVGYGAPAKGNTLLNYCGIGPELLAYTVDRSPHKQNKFLPGSRIPIRVPEYINADKPDYVLILPWNLATEISCQLAHIYDWGGKFVVPIPGIKIF